MYPQSHNNKHQPIRRNHSMSNIINHKLTCRQSLWSRENMPLIVYAHTTYLACLWSCSPTMTVGIAGSSRKHPADVSTHRGPMTTPPQQCFPLCLKETCQGHAPGFASLPPRMYVVGSSAGPCHTSAASSRNDCNTTSVNATLGGWSSKAGPSSTGAFSGPTTLGAAAPRTVDAQVTNTIRCSMALSLCAIMIDLVLLIIAVYMCDQSLINILILATTLRGWYRSGSCILILVWSVFAASLLHRTFTFGFRVWSLIDID